MRVKVGNTWYSVEPGQPIAVELTEGDKANIANMHPEATRYAVIDDDDTTLPTSSDRIAWLAD